MNHQKLMKEIEANLKILAEETDAVKKSEFFKKYLETMSKFWQYSYHNQLLIHFRMPEATRVAGFKKYQLVYGEISQIVKIWLELKVWLV